MTQATLNAHIRVNGQDEPLTATTLAALLDEKAVDVAQKGIAMALNGAVVPRADWPGGLDRERLVFWSCCQELVATCPIR